MVIQHNLQAMNSNRMLGLTGVARTKSIEKLSSGYRVNRAADDAAGLSVSEKMRRQMRGLSQSKENIQDGISYCNVAEGALSEISDMLARVEELAVQSANGTNTSVDRSYIDTEVQQIFKEIDRIFKNTTFNEQEIWPPVLEPHASGSPADYSMYSMNRADGSKVLAGIEYMGHRYSWTDLGIAWDEDTQTFTESNKYIIDSSVLKDDSSTKADDYDSTGDSAVFTIETKAGQSVASVQKNYSWSADNKGIRIDGVLADGEIGSIEGNSTWRFMGINPGTTVFSGEYEFDYYGMNVSFDVAGDMDWDDFTDAINKPNYKIDWHSTTIGQSQDKPVTSSGSEVSRIIINASDKDNIANNYKAVADENKIEIRTNPNPSGEDSATGIKSSSVEWTAIDGDYYGEACAPRSWGNEINSDYDGSETDRIGVGVGDSNDGKNYVTFMEGATYTYHSGESFLATNVGDLTFNMRIEQGSQAPEQILKDMNSISYTATKTVSPTTAVANDTSAKIHVGSTVSSNISFYTQRDILNRAYASNTENIVDQATVVVMGDKGRIGIDLAGYSMSANVYDSEYGSRIFNATDHLYKQMIDEYNEEVAAIRDAKWKEYVDDGKQVIEDMKSNGIFDEYITSKFRGEGFFIIPNENKLSDLGVDTTGKSADEIKEALNSKWDSLDASEKKSLFNSFTPEVQAAVVRRDLKYPDETNRDWLRKQYIGMAQDNPSIHNDFAVMDELIGFSTDEKIDIYKDLRDNQYSDIAIYDANKYLKNYTLPANNKFNKTETIKFSGYGNDKMTLAFDTSNVTYGDFIKPKTDQELKELIEGASRLNATDEAFSKDAVTKKFGEFITGTTFSLNGSGMSYQNVSYLTNHTTRGNKPVNLAEITLTKSVLAIQAGVEAGQHINIEYDNMRLSTLGLRGMHADTVDGASLMLYALKGAAQKVDHERSDFGAYTNRLEHAYNANYNTEENVTAAESRIRDTDMAKEMVAFTNRNILSQAGQAMLSQANQTNQGILSLLR